MKLKSWSDANPNLDGENVLNVIVELLAQDEIALREKNKLLELEMIASDRLEKMTISMRQARLGLLEKGLLDDVEFAISGLSRAAQIEWEYSVEVRRDYPLVSQLAAALNMTESNMDLFFENAKLL